MADDLRIAEFAFPGPLRDQLVAAILRGEKTATTGLLVEWELDEDPLPAAGERQAVIDSDGEVVAVIEITRVDVMRLDAVDLHIAYAEGEGYRSVAEWRESHEEFWNGYLDELRERLGDPSFALADDTPVVVERFRLVERR